MTPTPSTLTPKRPHDPEVALTLDPHQRPSIDSIIDLRDEVRLTKAVAAALRSGRYTQGNGVLRDTPAPGVHRYCCLGVFCDILPVGFWGNGNIFRLDDVTLPELKGEERYGWDGVTFPPDLLLAVLPEDMQDRARESFRALASMNDAEVPFEVIASIIQESGIYSVLEREARAVRRGWWAGLEVGRQSR